MKLAIPILVPTVLALSSAVSHAETVTIDHTTQRFLGPVSDLNRQKYFTLHSGANNDSDLDQFFNDYNVSKGRFFWGPFSSAKSQTGAVGDYPTPGANRGDRPVQKGLVATEHPANVIRYNINLDIAAQWAADYYKSQSSRPEFYEPMNEPFIHGGDDVFKEQQPERQLMLERMADWFNAVGQKFNQTPELRDMKIIGYSSAWPSHERFNFGHWNRYQKMFMDRAGANMDAFSTHLYDGINVTGQSNFRSGANSEAILDMIEAYSYVKWGTVKPHAITEYGGIESGFGDGYSDVANAQSLISINHLIFNLLERENDMLISIPFTTDKSTWHINEGNNYQPYTPVLFKPTNLGQPNPNGWEYTPRVYFYDLWKEFKGKRVAINANNVDLQVQAFAHQNKLYVALNNIDDEVKTTNLYFVDGLEGLQNVRIKSLKVFPDRDPSFTNELKNASPETISLIGGETVTLEYTFANNISYDNALRSKKYYSDTYLTAIEAGATQTYYFNGVNTGPGKASLRMTIGREKTASKSPTIRVNGTKIDVPNNWTGYDQESRLSFFGTIVVPFSIDLLNGNNEVTVEFPDAGGHLASMILQVEKYDNTPDVLNPPADPDPDTDTGSETPVVTQGPYNGTAATIPGRIEAENYDVGGQGVAYNDNDSRNQGSTTLRADEGADIAVRGDGTILGWTVNGEWLEYTVNTTAGLYDIDLRFATPSEGKAVVLTLDDDEIARFDLPVTGGYFTYQNLVIPNVSIPGGENKVLRLAIVGGSLNVNWINFSTVVLPDETAECTSIPSKFTSASALTFPMKYAANETRDVVVELWNGSTYITQGKSRVSAGSGTANITLNLNPEPVAGNNYLIKGDIRPVGSLEKLSIGLQTRLISVVLLG